LQAIINASQAVAVGGNVAQLSIPTPDVVLSGAIQYDRLYPARFSQPATYIRFSSTVEDSTGCPYCMNSTDEAFLSEMNAGKPKVSQCSEDDFEVIMNFFEETSTAKQPFAAVDNPPVPEYEEMEEAFDDTINASARRFASEVYEYWQRRRTEKGNRSLQARLKTPRADAQDADDTDPYICFHRREVRQVRKTRGRDAQAAEKLKKLRKELEDARQLVALVKQREVGRSRDLTLARQIFEQRVQVRDMKRALNIVDEEVDELLVAQRSPKKRAVVEPPAQVVASRPTTIRLSTSTRPEVATPSDMDIVWLRDKLALHEQRVSAQIASQIEKHESWNTKFVDRTIEAALGLYSPEDDGSTGVFDFVAVKATPIMQQPTPPESVADSEEGDESNDRASIPTTVGSKWRWAQPSEQGALEGQPRYRRRIGRGGRMMLDRHNVKSKQMRIVDMRDPDRFKYDHDDGDESSAEEADPYSTLGFRLRAHWLIKDQTVRDTQPVHPAQLAQKKLQLPGSRDVAMANGESTAGSVNPVSVAARP